MARPGLEPGTRRSSGGGVRAAIVSVHGALAWSRRAGTSRDSGSCTWVWGVRGTSRPKRRQRFCYAEPTPQRRATPFGARVRSVRWGSVSRAGFDGDLEAGRAGSGRRRGPVADWCVMAGVAAGPVVEWLRRRTPTGARLAVVAVAVVGLFVADPVPAGSSPLRVSCAPGTVPVLVAGGSRVVRVRRDARGRARCAPAKVTSLPARGRRAARSRCRQPRAGAADRSGGPCPAGAPSRTPARGAAARRGAELVAVASGCRGGGSDGWEAWSRGRPSDRDVLQGWRQRDARLRA